MFFEWDENKRLSNLEKHYIDFQDAQQFFDSKPICFQDWRKDYGEERFVAFGLIEGRLVITAYTRREQSLRIISMRKANARERRLYEQYIQNQLEQG